MTLYVPTVYLIRHATPDWSRTDIPYHIPPGPPLTPQGEGEAQQLGRFLWEAGVALIYVSPLERAWRTAEIAAGVAGAPIQQEAGLTEWGPEDKAEHVRARAWPVWEHVSLLSQQVGPVALVTHGGPVGVLLKELGLPDRDLDAYRRRFDRNNPLPPAGAWKASRLPASSAWNLSLVFTPEKFTTAAI